MASCFKYRPLSTTRLHAPACVHCSGDLFISGHHLRRRLEFSGHPVLSVFWSASVYSARLDSAVSGSTSAGLLICSFFGSIPRHMVKKRSNEAFISFKEALKFKRDSWQMWENYSHVAMDVGNVRQALEAIQMVLQITKCKQVDVGVLERVMLEMEGRASSGNSLCNSVKSDDSSTNGTIYGRSHDVSGKVSETQVRGSRETEQLVELLGKLLQQIIKSDSRADVWGLYARWQKIKGDLTMCSEALLKQVRSYQGSDLWKDRDRFIKFANASLELCKVYMEISSSTGSKRELFAAEMHLKNIAK